jgi:hypothetical protein
MEATMNTLTTTGAISAKRHRSIDVTPETALSPWSTLYRAGGLATLAMLILIPIQMAVFFIWPPPATVTGWFALFQNNPLVGLLDMDLLLIVDYVLFVLVYLALYIALRRVNESLMLIFLVFALVGAATYFASTAAFEMLSLSNRYAAATTDGQRTALLAAGEGMLANWQGTAFDVAYILGAIATLIVSIVMLRSDIFSRATAVIGVVMGILMLVPPSAGPVGIVLSILSLVPLVIWLPMVARRLFQLA